MIFTATNMFIGLIPSTLLVSFAPFLLRVSYLLWWAQTMRCAQKRNDDR